MTCIFKANRYRKNEQLNVIAADFQNCWFSKKYMLLHTIRTSELRIYQNVHFWGLANSFLYVSLAINYLSTKYCDLEAKEECLNYVLLFVFENWNNSIPDWNHMNKFQTGKSIKFYSIPSPVWKETRSKNISKHSS